eukprot:m.23872 g.23872  ORF g.23872 m.23872 type:complete len:191 (+) comp11443_c0_seq1:76-648(+)
MSKDTPWLTIGCLTTLELCVLLAADQAIVTLPKSLTKAFIDSAAHGVAAALPMLLAHLFRGHPLRSQITLVPAIVAGSLSCLLDIDHFILAGGFDLEKATDLPHRPLLHALPVALTAACLLAFLLAIMTTSQAGHTLLTLATTAVLTHHVRDGYRRGLWLWPLGENLAISYSGYLWFVLFVWPACLWLWL